MRSIRVFISSTFLDMMQERDVLMTHTWPALRRICAERHVELVEVDLRWGISEQQSIRKETLKLCLDEINASRPFFIGLLGERYGWVPGEEVFTNDLKEEQPWLLDIKGKSVTELEILHGVLNNPEMARRAFFFFRSPEYATTKGADFLPENKDAAAKQKRLKDLIRKTCDKKNIPLHENYADAQSLAKLVLEQLKAAIESQFPLENIPNPLDREASDHEAFAEARRHTYIGRDEYYRLPDRYCENGGKPILLLGDSGSGKSALLANWVSHWKKDHPSDVVFQHYIGGTPDSADHWKLMSRLMAEIKRWAGESEEPPREHGDMLRDFPMWLSRARIRAEHTGSRCIIILDALNQLEDQDRARLLGWLPLFPFSGSLHLIVSTLPGDTLEVLKQSDWKIIKVKPFNKNERKGMIVDYLARFGKKLDPSRLNRICDSTAAANPLYLKILLDELRVTGTHDKLDERIDDYLSALNILSLLGKVLSRYRKDYEKDRKNLVAEALGLIWASRRGLTEKELLEILKPEGLSQLPLAIWSPLRAALQEGLVDRGGILNFSHDFLRSAVKESFIPTPAKQKKFRLKLADYFETQTPTARTCDELPWLLWQTNARDKLRSCLLNIDCFLEIFQRSEEELSRFWVFLEEERNMGKPYLESFTEWSKQREMSQERIVDVGDYLGLFLSHSAIFMEAKIILFHTLKSEEKYFSKESIKKAKIYHHIAALLYQVKRLREAEKMIKQAIQIYEQFLDENHPTLNGLFNDLAVIYFDLNRIGEAESLFRKVITKSEKCFGETNTEVAVTLSNLAYLHVQMNHLDEAELLIKRALKIDEQNFGKDHINVSIRLGILSEIMLKKKSFDKAESLMRKALQIDINNFGQNHPVVSCDLNNLSNLLIDKEQFGEAEVLMRLAMHIDENIFGINHPNVIKDIYNLADIFGKTDRLNEAILLCQKAIKINEKKLGKNHPDMASSFNNLAKLLQKDNRLKESESIMRQAVEIIIKAQINNQWDPSWQKVVKNYSGILENLGWSEKRIQERFEKMGIHHNNRFKK